jgi:uncharacterized membrane protein YeiH
MNHFTLPIGFELTAVFLFAVTGALLAIEHRYDVVGVFVLAWFSAAGGGLIRDGLFLPQGLPVMLKDPRYLYVVTFAALLCLVFGTHLSRWRIVFLLIDALGLGTYAVVGTQRGLDFGLATLPAAFVGLVNAVGGGVLRDVLTGKETLLLMPGEFYVLAAAIGTALFLALLHWEMPAAEAGAWSIASTFVIRVAAVSFKLRTHAAQPIFGQRQQQGGF